MFKKKLPAHDFAGEDPPPLEPTKPAHLGKWNRQRTYLKRFSDGYGGSVEQPVMCEPGDRRANLCLSMVQQSSGWHAPAIDIDIPCELVPSTTPGHFHLFIDKVMPQADYLKLLDVMAEVGIVEKGYAMMARRKGYSAVRTTILANEFKDEVDAARTDLQNMLKDLEGDG